MTYRTNLSSISSWVRYVIIKFFTWFNAVLRSCSILVSSSSKSSRTSFMGSNVLSRMYSIIWRLLGDTKSGKFHSVVFTRSTMSSCPNNRLLDANYENKSRQRYIFRNSNKEIWWKSLTVDLNYNVVVYWMELDYIQ